jgi:hypothetical protein
MRRIELRVWLLFLLVPHGTPNDSLSELVAFAPCFIPRRLYLAYICVPPAEDPRESFLSFGVIP